MALRYYTKLVKSLRLFEHAKARYRTLFGCLALSICFLLVVRPYLESPDETVSSKMWMGSGGPSMLMIGNKDSSNQQLAAKSEKRIFPSNSICDISKPRSNFCEMKGDIRIHGNSSEILLVSSSQMGHYLENETWKIRPYARKEDPAAMSGVRELSLKSLTGHDQAPSCSIYHSVPALVFSTAGYAGNYFHDFTDVLVPLFITSRQYYGDIQFLITNFQAWWVDKYHVILKQLSRYEIINFDHDHNVHCFSNAFVGLRYHKELSIDPSRSPNRYSMHDFIRFLRRSYSLARDFAITLGDNGGKKPRLMIVSRKRTPTFTNVGEIVEMAEALGYEVVILEAELGVSLSEVSRIVNSCDVMMGVHGAGLTNVVFLPTNAVLIQVVPFGEMDWPARTEFAEPSVDMKIRYLGYKIEEKESTLSEQYPHDHPVLRDPGSISKQGWDAFRSIYLDKQNVNLDVARFRGTLLQALELLHH
ncbi:EGF domain-containing protein [Cinnamomum micranthum f. kanehirae]|uniref:EGF domain-containing protein n=1 Tax=Cinnamomum micranthum f. kanehirae TaxID=337451 RepID=A0A443PVP9_9MAGN|nr:EGF domain-containing protein [Cinnamomum micranthum f. kanehirae]